VLVDRREVVVDRRRPYRPVKAGPARNKAGAVCVRTPATLPAMAFLLGFPAAKTTCGLDLDQGPVGTRAVRTIPVRYIITQRRNVSDQATVNSPRCSRSSLTNSLGRAFGSPRSAACFSSKAVCHCGVVSVRNFQSDGGGGGGPGVRGAQARRTALCR